MTEQYAPRTINTPPALVFFNNTVADPDFTVPLGAQYVVINSLLAPSTVSLPLAASVPGEEITITALLGATNAVTVAGSGGDVIVTIGTTVLGANPIITNNASLTLRSIGGSVWMVVSGTSI